jgi:predicted kinase
MNKIILTCGVSSSGKSSYAKDLVKLGGWVEINRDTVRFSLFTDGVQDWSLYKFTKQKELEVSGICDKMFQEVVSLGLSCIVSNTNLNQKDIDHWQAKAESVGYEFEVKYFPITFEDALKRDSKRGALAVGREVLIQQWQKWLVISGYKRYTPDVSKPKAIWIDLDGTIALNTHRGHHDYDKVITDTPRLGIISMLKAWMKQDNLQPIFMSGRPDSCREDTYTWLQRYFPQDEHGHLYLYMRTTGDNRSDRIIKEELFWEHLAPHWNIVASVDDRKRVIRLQHDLKIPIVMDVSTTYAEY